MVSKQDQSAAGGRDFKYLDMEIEKDDETEEMTEDEDLLVVGLFVSRIKQKLPHGFSRNLVGG